MCAAHDGRAPEGNSRITRDSIAFSKSTAKPIILLQPINKPYEFKGATTLVDGMTGDRNYKTGRWIASTRMTWRR